MASQTKLAGKMIETIRYQMEKDRPKIIGTPIKDMDPESPEVREYESEVKEYHQFCRFHNEVTATSYPTPSCQCLLIANSAPSLE